MANENPFGPLPIDGHEPTSIIGQMAERIKTMSDAEAVDLLARVEADIVAKRQMVGVKAALESVLGTLVRVLV
jgi:hypothetical protein